MNDAQLIERLAVTDVYSSDASLPDEIWTPAAALHEIERRTDMQIQEHEPKVAPSPPPRRSPGRRWLVPALAGAAAVIIAVALAVVLLGGDDLPDVTNDPPPTPTQIDARPTTPVEVLLARGFGGDSDADIRRCFVTSCPTILDFDGAVMGIEPGTVTAEWFRSEGFYLVYFEGLDAIAAGSLCVAAANDRLTHLSYASIGDADCSWIGANPASTLSEPGRILQCDSSLAFLTSIPEDSVAELGVDLSKTVDDQRMYLTHVGGGDFEGPVIPEVDASIFEC